MLTKPPKLVDPKNYPFQRILVIRVDHIGDVVMSTPIFRALRQQYPSARLVAMTGSWGQIVLANNPNVDEVLVFDAPWWAGVRGGGNRWSRFAKFVSDYRQLLRRFRKERFDLVLDPRGDMRQIALFALASGARYRIGYDRTGGGYLLTHVVPFQAELHNVAKNLAILKPLGLTAAIPTEIHAGPEERQAVLDRLAEAKLNQAAPLAIIHPGARTMVKMWPASKFAAVADHLAGKGFAVAIVGGKEEVTRANEVAKAMKSPSINLAGTLSLLELVALFEQGQLFVCNDSGPMHLAAATPIAIVAVFGPTDPAIYGYRAPLRDWVYQPPACSPCGFESQCPYSDTPVSKCMEELPSSAVIEKVEEILSRHHRS